MAMETVATIEADFAVSARTRTWECAVRAS